MPSLPNDPAAPEPAHLDRLFCNRRSLFKIPRALRASVAATDAQRAINALSALGETKSIFP
jgi:hypothetical protein